MESQEGNNRLRVYTVAIDSARWKRASARTFYMNFDARNKAYGREKIFPGDRIKAGTAADEAK